MRNGYLCGENSVAPISVLILTDVHRKMFKGAIILFGRPNSKNAD